MALRGGLQPERADPIYKVSDTWYRFRWAQGHDYKEFMARAYFRARPGRPPLTRHPPSRGVMGVLRQLARTTVRGAARACRPGSACAVRPSAPRPPVPSGLLENLEQVGLFAIHERGVSSEAVRLVRSAEVRTLGLSGPQPGGCRHLRSGAVGDRGGAQPLHPVVRARNRSSSPMLRASTSAVKPMRVFIAVGEQDHSGRHARWRPVRA